MDEAPEKKTLMDHLSFAAMMLSSAAFLFGLGFAACYYQIIPHGLVESAREGFEEVKSELKDEKPWWIKEVDETWDRPVRGSDDAHPGLNLVTRVTANNGLTVEILDMDGAVVQAWEIDWRDLWSDAWHLPDEVIPKDKPGTHIDGAAIMDNGDLVFNFEHLGMVRLDPEGNTVWRLAYQTHHTVVMNGGYLWACGQRRQQYTDVRFPDRKPPYDEYTIIKIQPADGKIIAEWPVAELLHANGLGGLLSFEYKPGRDKSPLHRDDRLHLNDVEPFPDGMEAGYFEAGDVLVSLRNVNTIFAFNEKTGRIKFISTGRFTLQHDPDFIDGDTFSVFDNKFPVGGEYVSRIVVVTPGSGTYRTVFTGGETVGFYSDFMGEHQWLPNGNLLLTESVNGRAIEVDPDGRVVWEYRNFIGDGLVGIVEEVSRLPLDYRDRWSRP